MLICGLALANGLPTWLANMNIGTFLYLLLLISYFVDCDTNFFQSDSEFRRQMVKKRRSFVDNSCIPKSLQFMSIHLNNRSVLVCKKNDAYRITIITNISDDDDKLIDISPTEYPQRMYDDN